MSTTALPPNPASAQPPTPPAPVSGEQVVLSVGQFAPSEAPPAEILSFPGGISELNQVIHRKLRNATGMKMVPAKNPPAWARSSPGCKYMEGVFDRDLFRQQMDDIFKHFDLFKQLMTYSDFMVKYRAFQKLDALDLRIRDLMKKREVTYYEFDFRPMPISTQQMNDLCQEMESLYLALPSLGEEAEDDEMDETKDEKMEAEVEKVRQQTAQMSLSQMEEEDVY